ncbi:winged helix-turn-helix domain-containing protein [Corynebacterium guaraldiae]|uniref:GntR family transcriptional regulator n=1 Tax=Corynebacterium guaraldiae TaxID=3051103 RepID=UPI00259CE577|nr:winged helix-turn-helix domain-containing protein [Corynebacterium guaraldiae]
MALRGTQQHSIIADYLRNLIRSKKLSPGDFLPSEAELCEQFSSSRGPVRQAVAALRSEGLISSGRGRRSVVLGRFTSSPSTPSTP